MTWHSWHLLIGLTIPLWWATGCWSSTSSSNPGSLEDPLTNRPATGRPTQVGALGRLEPAGGVLNLAAMPGDRIDQLLVAVGQRVQAGDPLAILESRQLREQELQAARLALDDALRREPEERAYGAALIAAAQAGVEQSRLAEQELSAQQARLRFAEASLEVAREDVNRLNGLSERVIAPQEREHLRLRVAQGEAEVQAIQAELQRLAAAAKTGVATAEAKLSEAQAGSARLVSLLQIELLKQQVLVAEKKLALSSVSAPVSGQVVQLLTRQGETISQRPILRLADTSTMVVVCEVYETNVNFVAEGQRATITSKALPRALQGRVVHRGSLVAKKDVLSLNPAEATDQRVVEVRVAIDPADAPLAAELINLQVDVTIDVASPAGAPS